VAEDGEVVGFLTVQSRFETAAEVTWIAVRPTAGAGTWVTR
jgi:hypothetical protein